MIVLVPKSHFDKPPKNLLIKILLNVASEQGRFKQIRLYIHMVIGLWFGCTLLNLDVHSNICDNQMAT